jgi:putative FmdB family regulatory protein
MPTYSYRCTECATAFDIQQAFTDDTLTECPTCSGRLRKLFNAVGVTFNGSGFYRTDSRASAKDGGSATASSSDSSSSPTSAPSSAPAPATAASGSATSSSKE